MIDKKETAWAYAFFFFLGIWGAHKFYLGNTFMGFLYMFTFGLCGLGLLYDLFTLPIQVSHANKQSFIKHNEPTQSSCNCSCSC